MSDLGLAESSPVEGSIRGRDMESLKYPKALEELNTIAITEVLEHDSRPTFIIDLDPDLDSVIRPDVLSPIFCNVALRTYDRLLEVIEGETTIETVEDSEATYNDFRSWAKSINFSKFWILLYTKFDPQALPNSTTRWIAFPSLFFIAGCYGLAQPYERDGG